MIQITCNNENYAKCLTKNNITHAEKMCIQCEQMWQCCFKRDFIHKYFFFCITSSSFLIINSSCRSTSFYFSQMPHVPSGNAQLANQRLEPDIGIVFCISTSKTYSCSPKGKKIYPRTWTIVLIPFKDK